MQHYMHACMHAAAVTVAMVRKGLRGVTPTLQLLLLLVSV
jgi:hypothetical protein